MNILHCPQCKKLFQKKYIPICQECHNAALRNENAIYQFIKAHRGMKLEEVALRCRLPYKDVERMLFSGNLGTAIAHVLYACNACNRHVLAMDLKGRFCPDCAEKLEGRALLAGSTPLLEAEKREKAKAALNVAPTVLPSLRVEPTSLLSPPAALPAEEAAVVVPLQPKTAASSADNYGFKRANFEQ